VDRLGFQTLNNQRFGARFVGDVANPGDILLFHQRRRAPVEGDRNRSNTTSRSRSGGSNALALPVAPDADEMKVEDLVADQLNASDRPLILLKESELKDALDVSDANLRLESSILRFSLALFFLSSHSGSLSLSLSLSLSVFLSVSLSLSSSNALAILERYAQEYVNKQQANAINELVQNTLEDTQKKLNSSEYRGANTIALIHEAVAHENQGAEEPEHPTQSQVDGSQASTQSKRPEKSSGKR
jgi:hypothetical protein